MQKLYSLRVIFLVLIISFFISSCEKSKDEETTFIPPQQENYENSRDKEEFERLKQMMASGEGADTLSFSDTTSVSEMKIDTASIVKEEKKVEKKKEMVRKERELNKRVDNPVETINDYMEYLKRGINDDGNFDKNMENASKLWESRSTGKFKSYYKNTKKMSVISEPKIISQKGNDAVVEVKVKKIDNENGKEKETTMTVKYNLTADSNGKWKIKNNIVKTN
jgi:hypothetical protein